MAYRHLRSFLARGRTILQQSTIFYRDQNAKFSSSFLTSSRFGRTAMFIGVLGLGGGAYGYFSAAPERKKRTFATASVELKDYYTTQAPDIKPSRQVPGPARDFGLKLILYQYQTCPFCCKVRAFLEYYGIPYDIIEVNPVKRQQLKFSHYRKVPILVAHDEKNESKHQLNDSSVIISILGTYMLNSSNKLQDILNYYVPIKYTNDDGKEVTEVMNRYFLMYGENALNNSSEEIKKEQKWRKWADQEFVHVLSPNIYRSAKESLEAFNHFSEVGEWEKHFTKFERLTVIYVGAAAMYLVGKKLKKKHGLKDDVRESLYDYSRIWMKNVGKSKFMGGESPNLADLAVYGVLSSIEGCSAFQDLMSHTNIGSWYSEMKNAVEHHHGYALLDYKDKRARA